MLKMSSTLAIFETIFLSETGRGFHSLQICPEREDSLALSQITNLNDCAKRFNQLTTGFCGAAGC